MRESSQFKRVKVRFQRVVLFRAIVFLYRLTLMVTWTPVFSWVLRPSLQKLPAPPQPHISQRSVNRQTPPSIRWSICCVEPRLPPFWFTFVCFYLLQLLGLLHLSNLSLLAVCSRVYGDFMPSDIRWWKEEFQKQESRKGSSSQEIQTSITIRSLPASLFFKHFSSSFLDVISESGCGIGCQNSKILVNCLALSLWTTW